MTELYDEADEWREQLARATDLAPDYILPLKVLANEVVWTVSVAWTTKPDLRPTDPVFGKHLQAARDALHSAGVAVAHHYQWREIRD